MATSVFLRPSVPYTEVDLTHLVKDSAMGWVIVKRATAYREQGITRVGRSCSVVGSHTAKTMDVTTEVYIDREAAQTDLARLTEHNPAGDYTILEHDSLLDGPHDDL